MWTEGGVPGFVGEYRPPRELVSLSVARVTQRGRLVVDEQGLEVEGRLLTAPVVPRIALSVLVLIGVLAAALLPGLQTIALAATAILGGLGVFLYWRAEIGTAARARIAWSDVEHVVRLESDPDVIAVVLARPLAGPGSPEQLYFAATLGAEALADAFHSNAPPGVSIDLPGSGLAVVEPG